MKIKIKKTLVIQNNENCFYNIFFLQILILGRNFFFTFAKQAQLVKRKIHVRIFWVLHYLMLGYGNYNCINFCEMGVSIGAHAKCSRLSNKEKLFDILQCFFVKLFSNPQSKAIILVCDKKSYCRCVIVCVVECS